MKRIIALFTSILMVFLLTSCGDDSKSSTGADTQRTEQQEQQASSENTSVEPNKKSDSTESGNPSDTSENAADLVAVMSLLRDAAVQNYGENNYTLEYDETGVTLSLWKDNLAMGSALAATGDESAKEAWGNMVESHKTLCNSIVTQTKDIGLENYYVTVNVLNDMDKSKTLLTILNGVVVYDAVNG